MTLNLELSKLLYEKGVKLETEKWWFHHFGLGVDEEFNVIDAKDCGWIILESNGGSDTSIPAPSTDDLLAVLPDKYGITKINNRYFTTDDDKDNVSCDSNNPSEALGELIIYLINQEHYHYNQEKGILTKEG